MSPTTPLWRVVQLQQELARKNAHQALIAIQQRRRELEEAERVLPFPAQRMRSTRRSSQTGSADS